MISQYFEAGQHIALQFLILRAIGLIIFGEVEGWVSIFVCFDKSLDLSFLCRSKMKTHIYIILVIRKFESQIKTYSQSIFIKEQEIQNAKKQ